MAVQQKSAYRQKRHNVPEKQSKKYQSLSNSIAFAMFAHLKVYLNLRIRANWMLAGIFLFSYPAICAPGELNQYTSLPQQRTIYMRGCCRCCIQIFSKICGPTVTVFLHRHCAQGRLYCSLFTVTSPYTNLHGRTTHTRCYSCLPSQIYECKERYYSRTFVV